jgi:hypothetical protein
MVPYRIRTTINVKYVSLVIIVLLESVTIALTGYAIYIYRWSSFIYITELTSMVIYPWGLGA